MLSGHLLGWLISQGAAQSPSIPFWLQVVSIVLAPMLGFGGVAIGALLKDRSDRKQFLISERRAAYSEFSTAAEYYIRLIGMRGPRALSQPLSDAAGVLHRDIEVQSNELLSAFQRVEFIGSPSARTASRDLWEFFIRAQMAVVEMMQEHFDREKLYKFTREGLRLNRAFVSSTMKDLGIPKRERKEIRAQLPEEVKLKMSEALADVDRRRMGDYSE
jgi:hypothetical protein